MISWLPLYLVKAHGLTMSRMAEVGGMIYLVYAASSFIGGWLADRWIAAGAGDNLVRKSVVIASHVIPGASLLIAATADANVSIACLFAAAIGFGLNTSSIFTIGQTLAGPRAAGKWMGVQNGIGNIAGIVGPVITGIVIDRTGSFTWAFHHRRSHGPGRGDRLGGDDPQGRAAELGRRDGERRARLAVEPSGGGGKGMRGSAIALFMVAVLAAGVAESRTTVRHHAAHRHRAAIAKPRRHVAISPETGLSQGDYRPAFSARRDDRIPTSVEYRFGHGRIIGAVGYNRAGGRFGLDRNEVNSAAGAQFGHPDTVGAKVSIPSDVDRQ